MTRWLDRFQHDVEHFAACFVGTAALASAVAEPIANLLFLGQSRVFTSNFIRTSFVGSIGGCP